MQTDVASCQLGRIILSWERKIRHIREGFDFMEQSELILKIPRQWELRLRQLAEAGEYETLNDLVLEVLQHEFSLQEESH